MTGWLSPTEVAAHVGVTNVTGDKVALVTACSAAEVWVEGQRPDIAWATIGTAVPADVKLGAMMLAWRWYQRKSAPVFGGATGPTGDPVYLLKDDPDIARLLGVSMDGGFVFGAGLIDEDQAVVVVDLVAEFEDGLE